MEKPKHYDPEQLDAMIAAKAIERTYAVLQRWIAVGKLLDILPERDRDVVLRRAAGESAAAIAKSMKVTRARIRILEDRGLRVLANALIGPPPISPSESR
jgi:DNA-directed RNA polymerase specialized sigma24 family protein